MSDEQDLADKIEAAKAADDYELLQTLMQDLIALQKDLPAYQITDEELAAQGVDMQIVARERELREIIKTAQQAGDFIEAKLRTRELIRIQKLQPKQRAGVRYG